MRLFNKKNKSSISDDMIYAPVDGKLIDLSKVEDNIFANKVMGDGFAIEPTSNLFYSPISGVVETVFPTGHAFGIRRNDGVEVLVHIGVDTVSLKGKGFFSKIKQGDQINATDILAEVDLDLLKKEGYPITTMVIMTNHTPFEKVFEEKEIKAKESVLKIK